MRRRIRFSPDITFYKPQGIPLNSIEIVSLTPEEVEALRLKNVQNLAQSEAAKHMETSQSTFQRILTSAQKKISDAIVSGKGIRLEQ